MWIRSFLFLSDPFFFLSHVFTAIELGAYNIDKRIEHQVDISIYEVKD